jgi:hypothetical protein
VNYGNSGTSLRNLAPNRGLMSPTGASGNPFLPSADGPVLQFHPGDIGGNIQAVAMPSETIGQNDDLTALWLGYIDNTDGANSWLYSRGDGAADDSWRVYFGSSTNITVLYADSTPTGYTASTTTPTLSVGDRFTHISVKRGGNVESYFRHKNSPTINTATAGTGDGIHRGSGLPFRLGYSTVTGVAASHERLALFSIWKRALSIGEIGSLIFNPWQIFASSPRRVYAFSAAAAAPSVSNMFYPRKVFFPV